MSARSKVARRLGLAFAGLVAGLAAVEIALRIVGLPRFHDHKTEITSRFGISDEVTEDNTPVWVNLPGAAIRFRYDDNPRGYFDNNNELAHFTNKAGFRGGEFEPAKPADTIRIAFLGDSFTFGEGVRFEHTYPERLAALLRRRTGGTRMNVQSYNFGVGGYNTTQSLHALRKWALVCQPDIVVLGFALNDAEEPLYEIDAATGRPKRRNREGDVPEYIDDARPPDSLLYKSAIARCLWRYRAGKERANRIIAFYHGLYTDEQPGWQACKRSLRDISEACSQRGIPFVVVQFPALIALDNRYPFTGIHEQVRKEVESVSATFVDLLPHFKGRNAAALWVHPADQHPNEIAHEIAARALANKLTAAGIIEQVMAERSATETPEQQ